MSIATTLNKLGQSVMPSIAAKVYPDTLTVKAETVTAGTGGGQIKSGTTDAYTSVPCTYSSIQKFGWKKQQADKIVPTQVYMVTMPTHTSAGTRINLDPKAHTLIVAARGNEPAKTFRIISVGDDSGVVFNVMCSREG